MPHSVGLDIGLSSVKICLLDGSPRRPRLVDFIDHRFEKGGALDEDEIVRALDALLLRHRVARNAVVASMPAQGALIRDLSVPFLRDDQIAKTIKFQAEGAFHSVPVDQVVVDYYKYGEEGTKSQLLVIGVRKASVEKRIQFLERLAIDPVAIDLDVVAVFNAFTASPAYSEQANVVICDLGSGSLKIVVVEHGRLRAIRSLRSHLADLKEIPENQMKGKRPPVEKPPPREDEEAEADEEEERVGRLPLVILDDDESDVLDLMDSQITEEQRTDILSKILREMDRTLASIRLDEAVDKIYLVGGGSAHPGIPTFFSEHFGIPSERLDLVAALSGKPAPDMKAAFDRVGATSFGLALKGLGHDEGGLDFRQEEYAFAGRFERIKRGVACAVCILFVIFFALAYMYQLEARRHKKRAVLAIEQERMLLETFYQVDAADAAAIEDPYEAFLDRQTAIEQGLGTGEGIPKIRSALDILAEFTAGVQRAGVQVTLKRATLAGLVDQRSTVTLRTHEPDRCIEIARQLRDNGYFEISDPRITETRDQGEYEVEFTLTAIEERTGAR